MKRRRAIKDFVKKWNGRGKERQDAHPFWEELVECLFDVKHGRDYLDYEKPVPKPAVVTEEGQSPKYIDCYLKQSKCVIEQKSQNIPLLDKKGKPVWKSIGNLDYVCDWYALLAQYSLESSSQPIAISSYELEKFYPVKVEGSIPTTEEIEANLLERIKKG